MSASPVEHPDQARAVTRGERLLLAVAVAVVVAAGAVMLLGGRADGDLAFAGTTFALGVVTAVRTLQAERRRTPRTPAPSVPFDWTPGGAGLDRGPAAEGSAGGAGPGA